MKKVFFLMPLFFVGQLLAEEVSTATVPAAAEIRVIYPREGSKVPAVRRSFVLGSVKPSSASVTINGSTVSVYPTGSFCVMIPFTTGEFKILARADVDGVSTEAVRTVLVAPFPETPPATPLAIVADSIVPSKDMKLPTGEVFNVRFRGSPSAKAEARLKFKNQENGWQPMIEESASPGSYSGSLTVPREADREYGLEVRLTSGRLKAARAASPGKLKVAEASRYTVVEVSTAETILRTGPALGSDSMGYDLFLPRGTRLRAQGYIGTETRFKLSDSRILWGDEKQFNILPEGTPLPAAIVDGVHFRNNERSLLLTFDLNERVPFQILPAEDLKSLKVRLYYTVSNLDRIRYDTTADPWCENVRWSQPNKDFTDVDYSLKERIWGYDFRYEGSKLQCEVFFAPRKKNFRTSMEGITIAIDPGHSLVLGDGAVSPQGFKEGEVNYWISECLKKKLEKLGAKVFMTREREEFVSLADRSRRAALAKADVFVSVHTNAVPDGADPMSRSGFSVFYFHPMSLDLAKAVHASYPKFAGLEDDGLWYGNLAVCRSARIPAILVEAAYLIRPDEEELLLNSEFQCRSADGIAQGLQDFFKNYR